MNKAEELYKFYQEVRAAFGEVRLSEESEIKLALSLFIAANGPAAKKAWAPSSAPIANPAGSDGDTRTVVGKLTGKSKEEFTSSKGNPCTKFFYTVDGVKYNTIDKKISAALSGALIGQSTVEMRLKKDGKFENLISASIVQIGSDDNDQGDEVPF